MLSWAGMRGAIPIWLATFPVIAGIDDSDASPSTIVFFVVVLSTLVQGLTFEPLADRLGLTTNEPALPQPLVETGIIQELGGDVFAFRVDPERRRRRPPDQGARAAARRARQPDRARRRGAAATRLDGDRGRRRAPPADPPRGAAADRRADQALARRARSASKPLSELGLRGSPQIFSVRPTDARGRRHRRRRPSSTTIDVARDAAHPQRPRRRRRRADGRPLRRHRPGPVALGGRRALARWCVDRAERPETSPQDRSWWQEAVGVLNAPALR